MEPKHGIVRLDAAAEWLSKTTGRTVTADDLIDAHNKLPIYALIPKSLARPEYSAVVCHAVQKKAVEVAEAADRMAKKLPLKQVDVVELATETLPEDAALRYKWEKTAHEEGVYLLSARDLELLDIHGVQQLHRGVSIFNRWIGRPIQFGNVVDVTSDMLAVRRSHLVRYADEVKPAQQQIGEVASAERPLSEPARPTEQVGKRGSRNDNLKRAIFDAWRNGKSVNAPASEVFDYLVRDDDTGYIRGRDGNELMWENTSGRISRTSLAKLADRLVKYRAEWQDSR